MACLLVTAEDYSVQILYCITCRTGYAAKVCAALTLFADIHTRIKPEQLWPDLRHADLQALALDLDMRPVSQASVGILIAL